MHQSVFYLWNNADVRNSQKPQHFIYEVIIIQKFFDSVVVKDIIILVLSTSYVHSVLSAFNYHFYWFSFLLLFPHTYHKGS